MAKAIDVARHLIYLRNKDEYDKVYYSLSCLKLQKLLYFCQGGHYRWDGERLITDKYFELWRYGASIDSIYKSFSKYGQIDINASDKEIDKIKLSTEEKETIESVWYQFRGCHGFTLVQSITDDPPHTIARERNSIFITEEDIKDYFTRH